MIEVCNRLAKSVNINSTDGNRNFIMKPCDITPNYKFREDELIAELLGYINKTYDQHYAGGKIQATEDIIDDGHGTGFCIGNAKKYLKRYGKKGESPAEWRKDIMKVLHYSLIQLYVHDEEQKKKPKVLNDYLNNPAPFHHSIDDVSPQEWDAITKGGGQTVLDFDIKI